METIHDKSYKTLFSSPLFVQQLCEGFLPHAIHSSLDFNTLQKKPGNYITPALRDLYQDVVWAVDFNDGKQRVPLYLCLLLEFQSSPEPIMPLRMLNYTASFYQDLIKEKKLLLSKDKLPPVLPIVLYSGKPPWNVGTRMQDIMTAVPKLLRAFQPQLSYFLIDEHRLTQEAFEQAPELLADTLLLNHVDNAEEFSALWQALQHKVKNHPDFELLDRIIGRWFAYSLHLKGAKIKLEDITSIDEATAMWTFESEIERMRQENAATRQAALSAQQKLEQKLRQEQELRQALEQNTLTAIKGMFAEGISSDRIAKILNISEAKVAEYLHS